MSFSQIKSKVGTVNRLYTNYKVNNGYFGKKGNKRLVVIMYHGIDQVQNTDYNLRFFSKTNFENHIILYKKHFNVLSHTDFTNQKFSDEKLNAVITFDDGYLNNFKYALPVLEKYNAHAYFFVTGLDTLSPKILWADALDIVLKHGAPKSKITAPGIDFELINNEFINRDTDLNLKSFIRDSKRPGYSEKETIINQLLSVYDFTKKEGLADYWKLMDGKEILAASKSKYITIGSHGFYHNNLGSLSNSDAVDEVKKSKNYLSGIIQKEVNTIGFPDGSYTEDLNQSLFELGFMKQFLVQYKFSDSGKKDYVYDRLGLYPYMGNAYSLLHKIIN